MACLVDLHVDLSSLTDWTSPGAGLNHSLDAPPAGLAVASSGTLVVAEPGANLIRWIDVDGTTTTAGGTPGLSDGPRGRARFRRPLGVAAGIDGSVAVADSGNNAIRRVGVDGVVTTLAGGVFGQAGGQGNAARFAHPGAVAFLRDGTLVVADTGNNTVRRVDHEGSVSTLAGSIRSQGMSPGPRSFREPAGVAADADGTIYVADTGNNRICRIRRSGRVEVVAGQPPGGLRDGNPTEATFRWPTALAVDADGTLYVADTGNRLLRKIDPGGAVSTIGGEAGWTPVGLGMLGEGWLVVAETRWAPYRSLGRLRSLPTA